MEYATVLFDVNETLSDMTPLTRRFTDVGASGPLATLWFSNVLRDGFALAAAGDQAAFADIAAGVLRGLLDPADLNRPLDAAVHHVMEGFSALALHDDVPEGIRGLKSAGYGLATLSNGSVTVAGKLLGDAHLRDEFDLLLSVEDAPAWKPGAAAYRYAATACHADPSQLLLAAVHPWDIHGASRAGLATAWINRTDAQYPAHFRAPDHTVPSLRELPPELGLRTC